MKQNVPFFKAKTAISGSPLDAGLSVNESRLRSRGVRNAIMAGDGLTQAKTGRDCHDTAQNYTHAAKMTTRVEPWFGPLLGAWKNVQKVTSRQDSLTLDV